jgi:hypothetical protein
MFQKFCRIIGIQASEEDIRDLISALRELPLRGTMVRHSVVVYRDYNPGVSQVETTLLQLPTRSQLDSDRFTMISVLVSYIALFISEITFLIYVFGVKANNNIEPVE